MIDNLAIERMSGEELKPCLDGLAQLRIAVFREFPYLYDGTMDYELDYLRTYVDCPESIVVIVRDEDRIIGATTGLPLDAEHEEFQKPFRDQGINISKIFYFGESILLPAYRGRGLGHRFFDEREAHAARLGRFDLAAFCAVQRPADHPRRPANYRPLDDFWRSRGYTRCDDLRTAYTWQDLDESEMSPKPMVFWIREIRRA